MSQIILNFKSSIKQMNKISRTYIKYGNIIVCAAACAFLFCCTIMGKFGNYDNLLYLRGELLILLRDMISAIYVPAIIIEILKIAFKNDTLN